MNRKRAILGSCRGTKGDFLLLGIAFTIVFLVFGSCIGISLVALKSRVTSDFCQPTDKTYQFIVVHKDEWRDHFASVDPILVSNLQVQLPNGGTILVFSDYYSQRSAGKPVLYISTLFDWPATPKGGGGYLITPSSSPPETWSDTYRLKAMSDQIYCYSEKNRAAF